MKETEKKLKEGYEAGRKHAEPPNAGIKIGIILGLCWGLAFAALFYYLFFYL